MSPVRRKLAHLKKARGCHAFTHILHVVNYIDKYNGMTLSTALKHTWPNVNEEAIIKRGFLYTFQILKYREGIYGYVLVKMTLIV